MKYSGFVTRDTQTTGELSTGVKKIKSLLLLHRRKTKQKIQMQ